MPRLLPIRPDLDHLKNEAKGVLKAHRAGDASCCEVLRHLRRFAEAPDAAILAGEVKLTEAQFALARAYGFRDWAALRAVVPPRPAADFVPDARPDARVLADPPVGGTGPDRITAALAMALGHVGAPVDAASVAGDLGMAFILQADALHKPYGAEVPTLDMGWWPLDPWGVHVRLDFLARAAGVPLRMLGGDFARYRADPREHYGRFFADAVAASLDAGRPVVAVGGDNNVIVGLDGGEPPLLAQLSCRDRLQVERMSEVPWSIIVLGEPGEPMGRAIADVEAIDYAIRLGRDEVALPHLPGKSSGRASWRLWAAQLADETLAGPHYYHANVVGHLKRHRRCAVEYLDRMTTRHPEAVGDALKAAAAAYDGVLATLETMKTGKDDLAAPRQREAFAGRIGEAMDQEAAAQEHLATALREMRHDTHSERNDR